MARISKQKACIACTESKRRCDKGLPSSSPDLFSLDAGPLSIGLGSNPWIDFGNLPSDVNTAQPAAAPVNPQASAPLPQQAPNTTTSDTDRDPVARDIARSKWFLAPSTWRIDHLPTPPRNIYPTSVLTNFTRGLQTWVHRWVLHGHNPFIHRSMYAEGNYFPSCLQDAFTSASMYHHKTPQNEAFVYRILDERVTAMMASQPVTDETSLSVPLLETRDHLARVQALFVYTVLRLFDGSISQRAAAEVHLPTLSLWCRQLWDSASLDANALSENLVPVSKYCNDMSAQRNNPRDEDDTYDSDLSTYNLWVLSESVRRTWLIVTCTVGVYATLKGSWSECPGGALFTARAGLWDAPSAPRWASLCRELAAGNKDAYERLTREETQTGGVGGTCCDGTFFVPSFHSEGLFRNAAAADVDEFARHLFTIIWGLDRVESWALNTASAGEVCLTY
uniref:RNA polymerase ii mediator complex component n=1 Tax=Colletotrichum fructicola (strain Nara gc5) TaxID=1213859 RepID=L2GI53_COLFN